MTRIALLLALGLPACGPKVPIEKDEAFAYAVDATDRGAWVAAANAAWRYHEAADVDDPRYDRGLRLLGRSAESLGLTFAAGLVYREIALERRNLELLPEAVAGIERLSRGGPFDEDSLLVSVVAADELVDLPADTQAFVDFEKGLDLSRRGLDAWAEARFARISAESPYAEEAEYVRAVRAVADGRYGDAHPRLDDLAADEALEPGLRLRVERTRARLAFEESRFDDALASYEALRTLAPDDPELLLEMAWTSFYLGDARRTLGLLVAMDAPVHATYISPERHLLEALALRRLCQFEAARQAADRLEARYGDALRALGAGRPPDQIPQLRDAAALRGRSRTHTELARRLEAERASLRSLPLDGSLERWLDDRYERGLAELRRREAARLPVDLRALTEELLATQEGMRLVVHELGVSMLRGRRRPAGPQEAPATAVPFGGEAVFYPFTGEYWTDELDDLVVVAEDRCVE